LRREGRTLSRHQKSGDNNKHDNLKAFIKEGLDDLKTGNVRPGKEVFTELREKINSNTTAKK
jgi:predicted transcriptional regulator